MQNGRQETEIFWPKNDWPENTKFIMMYRVAQGF